MIGGAEDADWRFLITCAFCVRSGAMICLLGPLLLHVGGLAICQKWYEQDRLEGGERKKRRSTNSSTVMLGTRARSTLFDRVYKQRQSFRKSGFHHSLFHSSTCCTYIHPTTTITTSISFIYIMRSFVFFIALFYMVIMANALPIQKRESGALTFYTPGLGSCGKTSSESDMVAALSSSVMSSGDKCGKELSITYKGKDVSVTAVDTCPSCGSGDIDVISVGGDRKRIIHGAYVYFISWVLVPSNSWPTWIKVVFKVQAGVGHRYHHHHLKSLPATCFVGVKSCLYCISLGSNLPSFFLVYSKKNVPIHVFTMAGPSHHHHHYALCYNGKGCQIRFMVGICRLIEEKGYT